MLVGFISLNARGDERADAGFEQGAAIAQVVWVAMECSMVMASLNRGCALDGGADALVRAAAAQVASQRRSDSGVARLRAGFQLGS